MTVTRYPNDPPLMWFRDTRPTLIGCTACTWWIKAPGGGWVTKERAFKRHIATAHPDYVPVVVKQPRRWKPATDIANPGDSRHGTIAGAKAHRTIGEDPCERCLARRRAYDNKRKRAIRLRKQVAA